MKRFIKFLICALLLMVFKYPRTVCVNKFVDAPRFCNLKARGSKCACPSLIPFHTPTCQRRESVVCPHIFGHGLFSGAIVKIICRHFVRNQDGAHKPEVKLAVTPYLLPCQTLV